MPDSFDFIDNRFFHQRIKVPKVVCQEEVQEFGDITILAPAGLVLNPLTGELLLNGLPAVVTLQLAGAPQQRAVTVLPGKVINQGVVPVSLLVNGTIVIQLIEIPFQGIVECPCAVPGDIVQKHDVQVEGFSISPLQTFVAGVATLNLILKVVLEMCVIVTEETILKVNAAETFCK